MRLNKQQFEALVKLLRVREGSAREGCRAVFCDGLSVPEASSRVHHDYKALWNAVNRMRDGHALCATVMGLAVTTDGRE